MPWRLSHLYVHVWLNAVVSSATQLVSLEIIIVMLNLFLLKERKACSITTNVMSHRKKYHYDILHYYTLFLLHGKQSTKILQKTRVALMGCFLNPLRKKKKMKSLSVSYSICISKHSSHRKQAHIQVNWHINSASIAVGRWLCLLTLTIHMHAWPCFQWV